MDTMVTGVRIRRIRDSRTSERSLAVNGIVWVRALVGAVWLNGAVEKLLRVTKGGGAVYVIEPDFETQTINLSDRDLVRKVFQFYCDNQRRNGWIGRELQLLFEGCGLRGVGVEAGVVTYEPRSFAPYFLETAHAAFRNGIIVEEEPQKWLDGIGRLLDQEKLFCTISYFMAMGRTQG
jgi:hypothetical protein